MNKQMKRFLAGGLTFAMSVAMVAGTNGEAAAKPKFSTKKITVQVGKTKTLKAKNVSGAKLTWKVKNKKVAKLTKSSKTTYKVKGLKVGSTKVTCTVKRKKKKTVTLSCTIKVTKRVYKDTTDTSTPAPTAPASVLPTATPIPTPKPPVTPIKDTYQPIFGEIGNCVSLAQLESAPILEHVKKHYTSITLENEMKPDAILKNDALVSTTEAKTMSSNYVIPDNYAENTVPGINYEKVDAVLKIAYENGLKMRAHTLVWHSQTPEWFFKTDYNNDGDYVTTDVMDARMEMFIRSVMNHVYTIDDGKYKDTVYAWDVANEYLHNNANANWSKVYGNREGNLENNPPYVKKAFEIAYSELEKFELTNKVKLFYNDYNTYKGPDDVVALIRYINEGEANKICSGIGMQSHIDYDYPTPAEYAATIRKFKEVGLEIQITEFDATINNNEGFFSQEYQKRADQADYVGRIMKAVVAERKAGANITSFTIWGLYDKVSWRGGLQWGGNSQPTLFRNSINDPKDSYYTFMDAAKVWNS